MGSSFEKDLIATLLKRGVVILLIAAVTAGGVAMYKRVKQVTQYSASVEIAVADSKGSEATVDDVKKSRELVGFYCRLMKSSTNLEDVIATTGYDLSLDQLRAMITVTADVNSNYIDLEVKSGDPEQAKALAVALAEGLQKQELAVRKENLTSIATYPNKELPLIRVDAKKYIAAGFVGGFFLAWFALYLYDQRMKSRKRDER